MQQQWQCQLSLKQGRHDDSQNSREAAWFHRPWLLAKWQWTQHSKIKFSKVKLEMTGWRKQWFSITWAEQWMSTIIFLHHLFPWSMLWWMTSRQWKHVFGRLLLFVKHSSVLVVIIEALFWVFQLIRLMLGACLAHFLHVVDWSIVWKWSQRDMFWQTFCDKWCVAVFSKRQHGIPLKNERFWCCLMGFRQMWLNWADFKILLSLSRSLQIWCTHWEIFEKPHAKKRNLLVSLCKQTSGTKNQTESTHFGV